MFPKAKNKRFNEEYGCAPPVGYYNPNDKHKIRGVALDKMERPACVLPCDGINSDVSVSSSSSLSNGSMRSAKLCQTPFKTPFHIKSCVSSTPGLNKLTRDRFFSEPNEGSQVEKKLLESISSLEKERKDYLLQLDNYKTKVVELETELAIRGREVNEKDLQVSDYQGKLEETDQKVHNLHCEVLHLKQILCVSSSDVSASETNQLLQEYTTCHKEKVEEMETEVTGVRTELSEKELLTTDLLKLKATLLNGVEGCTEKLGILKGDIQELNDLVTHNNHYSSVENVGTYSTNQLENLASKVLSVEPHKTKKLWEEVNQKLSSCSTEGELEIERSEGCKRVQNKEGIEIQKIMNNPVEKMLSLEKEMKQLHLYIVKYLDLKNSEVCAVKSENSSLKKDLTEVIEQLTTYQSLIEESTTSSQKIELKYLENGKESLNVQENTELQINQFKLSLDEKDAQLEASKSKLTELESTIRTLEASLDEKDTQLEASKSKFTELESSIRTLEASLDEKDTQLEATKSKLNELESSVGTLEASLEEKDTQLEASKSKLTELESTIRTLEASLDEKDTQLEATKSKLTEIESSVGTLEALLDKKDTQLEASKSKLTELESSVGTLEELCRKFNDEKCQIKNLKTERSVLENQLKEIQETVVILETAAHEKDDYLNNKTSEVIELKKEKSELEKRLVTVKTEIEYLQTMLEENVAKISERDLKISQLQNEKYCLIEWIKIAENKTNDVLSCLEDKNRCIKNLRMELLEEQETKLKLKRQLECVNEEQKNQKYLTDGKDEIIQKLSSKVLSIYNETEQVGSQLTSLDLEIERKKAYISSQEKDSSISPLTSEKVLEGKLENLEKELFHSLHQKNVSVSLVESENICLEESSEQVEKEIDEIKLQNKECLVQKSNEISKLESDKMIIEKALDMIRQQFHNLQFELQKQNNLITIRNSQLSCLETEKSNLQSQLAHYEEKFKNQDNILNEKEEDISAKNAKIETLDNKLEILVQETNFCRLEKQSAIEELARIQEKAKESDRIIEELTEKNNNTEDQVIKLSNEVGHLQERMIEFIFENELEQTKSDQRLLEELLRNEEFEKSMRADVEEIQRHNNKQKNDLLSELEMSEKCICSLNAEFKKYQEETEREIFELHIQVNFYEEKLKFLEDLRSSMNVETEKIEDLERELNKWKNLYLDLQEKVNPFKEQLDAFQAERQLLLNQNTEVHSELVNLSKQYAYLLGHQNHKQKIKHIMKIKQENMDFRQDIAKLRESNDKLHHTVAKLQDQLARIQPEKTACGTKRKVQKDKENVRPLHTGNHL